MSLRFRQITVNDLSSIMMWRMSPEITQFMCTDCKLTLKDQQAWYERIKQKEDAFYWILEADRKAVGLVSLVDWDKRNGVIHTGAYIADHNARTLQNIVDMNMNLFAYCIEALKVNKIGIEIMSNNVGMLNWVLRFGAKKEGILRQAIRKNGEYFDLHLFSILASEWPDIQKKVHYNKIEIEEKL